MTLCKSDSDIKMETPSETETMSTPPEQPDPVVTEEPEKDELNANEESKKVEQIEESKVIQKTKQLLPEETIEVVKPNFEFRLFPKDSPYRPWIRSTKNLDPDGKILRETIEHSERMREKYNSILNSSTAQGKYSNIITPSLINTCDMNKVLEEEDRALQKEKKKIASKKEAKRKANNNPPPKMLISQRDVVASPYFLATSNRQLTQGHNNNSQRQLQQQIPIMKPNLIRSLLPPGFDPSQPPMGKNNAIQFFKERIENPLEVEAIMQYTPGLDSKHDMIFGNVIGVHYGGGSHSHHHGMLWPHNSHPFRQGQNQHQQCLQRDHSHNHNIMGSRNQAPAIQGPGPQGYQCLVPCYHAITNHNVIQPSRHHHWQDVTDHNNSNNNNNNNHHHHRQLQHQPPATLFHDFRHFGRVNVHWDRWRHHIKPDVPNKGLYKGSNGGSLH